MRPVVAIAVHELKRFLADRFNLFFVLVLPMILVVVLGLQATSQTAGQVGVLDAGAGSGASEGSGALATALVEQLEATGLEATAYTDLEELDDAVTEGVLDLGVVVGAPGASTPSGAPALEMVAPGAQPPPGLDQLVRGAADEALAELGRSRALVDAGSTPADVTAALQQVGSQREPATVEVRSTDPVQQS